MLHDAIVPEGDAIFLPAKAHLKVGALGIPEEEVQDRLALFLGEFVDSVVGR